MDTGQIKIMVVDDEQDILEILKYNLEKEGFNVYTMQNGREAIDKAREINPQLIVLDIMMPELDGMETCREIRNMPEMGNTLIAFLTARNEDYSQIAGFDVGADDYISKPIKPRVFLSRVKALLRRHNGRLESKSIYIGDLEINRDKYLVFKGKEELSLPRKEFEILELLANRPGKVYSRDEILQMVWGNEIIVGERTIDVHVRKLREKLGEGYIKTVKGVGYKLDL